MKPTFVIIPLWIRRRGLDAARVGVSNGGEARGPGGVMKGLVLSMNVASVVDHHGPLKARQIAARLSREFGEKVTRKQVNQVLYANLKLFSQNERFEWSKREEA